MSSKAYKINFEGLLDLRLQEKLTVTYLVRNVLKEAMVQKGLFFPVVTAITFVCFLSYLFLHIHSSAMRIKWISLVRLEGKSFESLWSRTKFFGDEKSNDLVGNRTRDFRTCGIVSQPI